MNFFRSVFTISLLVVLGYTADAQFFDKRARYHALGIHLIGSYFNGDIASGYTNIRPGIGLQYMYKFSSHATFIAGVNYFQLSADDGSNSSVSDQATVNTYIRNLHMRNTITEGGVSLRYDVFTHTDHYQKRPSFNVFGTVGIGLLHSNPQAKDSAGTWTDLRPLKTEGHSYSSYSGFIPLSVGMTYKLSATIDLEFEISYRVAFTDYLDDVKGKYADPETLNNESSRYFANRSTDSENSYSGSQRDLDYVTNRLGYPILTDAYGDTYVSGTGAGQRRGTQIGPDRYILAMLRLVIMLPQKGISCPRY